MALLQVQNTCNGWAKKREKKTRLFYSFVFDYYTMILAYRMRISDSHVVFGLKVLRLFGGEAVGGGEMAEEFRVEGLASIRCAKCRAAPWGAEEMAEGV